MLRDYGKNYDGIWVKLGRPFIIILAFGLVVLAMYLVGYFWNMLSEKQETFQRDLEEEKDLLLDQVSVLAPEAGYVIEGDLSEQLYVPTLRAFVTNRSEQEMDRLFITVLFRTGEKIICRTRIPLLYLQPNDMREIKMRCAEILGFGTILKGLKLIDTTAKIYYRIEITRDDVTAVYYEGELEYKILGRQSPAEGWSAWK